MGAIRSQSTTLMIVFSTVYSGADQRKHESPAALAFVRGIQRRPTDSPHKWPVTRKMFPLDDVIKISYVKTLCWPISPTTASSLHACLWKLFTYSSRLSLIYSLHVIIWHGKHAFALPATAKMSMLTFATSMLCMNALRGRGIYK